MNVSAVVVAAGRGRRFGGRRPKQFLPLAGHPLLYWSLRAFDRTPVVRSMVLVVAPEFLRWGERFVRARGLRKVVAVVPGGAERGDSVRNGVRACPPKAEVILVHDAARPLVTSAVIANVTRAALRTGAALAAWPVPDTLKAGSGKRPLVRRTVPRDGLWLAQTPQGFRRDVLKKVLCGKAPKGATDDVQWVERLGLPVELVPASPANFKVTVPEDFEMADIVLSWGAS